MAQGSKNSLSLRICSLLMAFLFALSASFQFDDPDWYFWIPLYATGCIVNVVNWAEQGSSNSRIIRMAKFAFLLGVFLFTKVAIEGYLGGNYGFWSLEMRERIVREKFGSGLVISSMFLFLDNSKSNPDQYRPTKITKYGMPILVGVAYGLSLFFFAFQHDEMRY